jgi:copper(I)-binding protein
MKTVWTMALGAALAALALQAQGHVRDAAATDALDAADSKLKIESCWIRLLPQQLPAGAYFVIKNDDGAAATLTGVRSEAYGSSMLHQSKTAGGMAKMEMAHDIAVPAHGELVFAPGGYHVMLQKPTHLISVGDKLRLDFQFAGGATQPVMCEVRPAGAQ